jgi:hypothetical protein
MISKNKIKKETNIPADGIPVPHATQPADTAPVRPEGSRERVPVPPRVVDPYSAGSPLAQAQDAKLGAAEAGFNAVPGVRGIKAYGEAASNVSSMAGDAAMVPVNRVGRDMAAQQDALTGYPQRNERFEQAARVLQSKDVPVRPWLNQPQDQQAQTGQGDLLRTPPVFRGGTQYAPGETDVQLPGYPIPGGTGRTAFQPGWEKNYPQGSYLDPRTGDVYGPYDNGVTKGTAILARNPLHVDPRDVYGAPLNVVDTQGNSLGQKTREEFNQQQWSNDGQGSPNDSQGDVQNVNIDPKMSQEEKTDAMADILGRGYPKVNINGMTPEEIALALDELNGAGTIGNVTRWPSATGGPSDGEIARQWVSSGGQNNETMEIMNGNNVARYARNELNEATTPGNGSEAERFFMNKFGSYFVPKTPEDQALQLEAMRGGKGGGNERDWLKDLETESKTRENEAQADQARANVQRMQDQSENDRKDREDKQSQAAQKQRNERAEAIAAMGDDPGRQEDAALASYDLEGKHDDTLQAYGAAAVKSRARGIVDDYKDGSGIFSNPDIGKITDKYFNGVNPKISAKILEQLPEKIRSQVADELYRRYEAGR